VEGGKVCSKTSQGSNEILQVFLNCWKLDTSWFCYVVGAKAALQFEFAVEREPQVVFRRVSRVLQLLVS
jgi:hypothetical protein